MKKSISRKWKALALMLLTVLLCIIMCFSLAACGSSNAPYIGDNGNWYVNGEDTGVPATGPAGQDGVDGQDGQDGQNGADGQNGQDGQDGQNGADGEDGKDGVSSGNMGGMLPTLYDDQYEQSDPITETTISPGTVESGRLGQNNYSDYASDEERYEAGKELAEEIGEEGIVLLKNKDNALPLRTTETKVSTFGIHTQDMIHAGGGSGGGTLDNGGIEHSDVATSLMEAGYSVNPSLLNLYQRHITLGTTDNELPWEYYSGSVQNSFTAYNDAAVITFSRIGAENEDCRTDNVASGNYGPDQHYLQLDLDEQRLVTEVKNAGFEKIIVVLNTANIMEIPALEDDDAIDAILWVGTVGNNSINALGRILNGSVTPSGHTSGLWERDFSQSPTWTNFGWQTQNDLDAMYYLDDDGDGQVTADDQTIYTMVEYREDIYLGYKYYETAYADASQWADDEDAATYDNVLYPFGYGLSYTTFDWVLDGVAESASITSPAQTITVRVWVKNTGHYAGKDVVQVYYTPEYYDGGIEKAAVNLVGFAKTKLLYPGESDLVTITFNAQDMASFDYDDANGNGFKGWELEQGDYTISLRTDSHTVKQGNINEYTDEKEPLQIVRTVDSAETNDPEYKADATNTTTGFLCREDLESGNDIDVLFGGGETVDTETVPETRSDMYLSESETLRTNKISRATGMRQPAPASIADRTISQDVYDAILDTDTYDVYDDKTTDPWYVSAVPTTWNQDQAGTLTFQDMIGVKYNEPTISSGVAAYTTAEYDEGTQKWEKFMNQLSYAEMVSLIINGGGAPAVPSVGKPADTTSDGPVQIRGGTLFPCNGLTAATFNEDLAYAMGRMVGNDAIAAGTDQWLGSGLNTHRSPFSGRNFEYYSEDGMLGGIMGAAAIRGATDKGIITCTKHYFLNDQESYRADWGGIATFATEQAMREIYLRPFEMAVEAGSLSMMTSFNKIGMYYTNSCNPVVQQYLLRDQLGFEGYTLTDAWAKDYTPINLMIRTGQDELLGSGSGYPKNNLTYGTWDAENKTVLVPADAEEKAAGDNTLTGSGTADIALADNSDEYTASSATHYYHVRKAAQRILYARANSIANNNGIPDGMEIDIQLQVGVSNAVPIEVKQTTDTSLTVGAEAQAALAAAGLSITNGVLTGTPAMDQADFSVNITLVCDGWIQTTATLKITFVSAMQIDGKPIADNYNMPVSSSDSDFESGEITVPYYAYHSVNGSTAIVNYYRGSDGSWYSRNEDKTASDIICIDASEFDKDGWNSTGEYRFTAEGLPEGLTLEHTWQTVAGFNDRDSYQAVNGVKIVMEEGATVAAGTYTVTVTLHAPSCMMFNGWIFTAFGLSEATYSTTFTITVT